MMMGVGYVIKCEKCGNSKDILIGSGMIPPQSFKEPILTGEYGQDAAEMLELHPDWEFYIENMPFSCSCNYVTSFPVAIFFTDKREKIRCDRFRCPQCGKVLRANSWGKGICWKCGGPMNRDECILWD